MLRIFLFLLTNLAVIVVASITLRILKVDSYLTQNGIDFWALLVFCFVFGMTGSFISLLLSKWMAKRSTGTQLITSDTKDPREAALLNIVSQLARQAGIGMPEVGVFPAQQANAFATGFSKNNALVAISQGMLNRYSESEIKAVMAHEITHVTNGDMVTMSLLQGIINTFVMFLARVIGYTVDKAIFKSRNERGIGYFLVVIVCEIILSILASVIVMWFSRVREYKADSGAARLSGAPSMIAALEHLQKEHEMPDEMPQSLNAFGIAQGRRKGFSLANLFRSHPPLNDRIKALQNFRR
jgi:heat shock protein HtpX